MDFITPPATDTTEFVNQQQSMVVTRPMRDERLDKIFRTLGPENTRKMKITVKIQSIPNDNAETALFVHNGVEYLFEKNKPKTVPLGVVDAIQNSTTVSHVKVMDGSGKFRWRKVINQLYPYSIEYDEHYRKIDEFLRAAEEKTATPHEDKVAAAQEAKRGRPPKNQKA